MNKLSCPHCGARISVLHLRRVFDCRVCGAHLRGRTASALIAVFVLWSLADMATLSVAYGAFPGSEGTAFAAHLLVSVGIGAVLFAYCLPRWVSVSRAP